MEDTTRLLPLSLPLRVETAGESGDPVVCLHGFGACNFTWRYWAPRLARRHRVYLVEPKRFPPGDEPTPEYHTPGGQAELVYSLIVEEDLHGVTLVGHSLGGGIALLTALALLDRGEDRLRALVLVCGAAYPQQIPPFISLARIPVLGELVLAVLPARWLVRLILRFICYDRDVVTEDQVEAYSQVLRSRGGRYGLVRLARRIIPDDIDSVTQRFSRIDTPTLLLWGAHDPVVPLEIGRRLKGDLPRAELVVLERCGHMPPEERPRASVAALERFLDGIAPATDPARTAETETDDGPPGETGGGEEAPIQATGDAS